MLRFTIKTRKNEIIPTFLILSKIGRGLSFKVRGSTTEEGTSRETCARHVRRAISPASFNLEGYKLA